MKIYICTCSFIQIKLEVRQFITFFSLSLILLMPDSSYVCLLWVHWLILLYILYTVHWEQQWVFAIWCQSVNVSDYKLSMCHCVRCFNFGENSIINIFHLVRKIVIQLKVKAKKFSTHLLIYKSDVYGV